MSGFYYRGRSRGRSGGGARWMASKYSGTCRECGGRIAAGEQVYWWGPGAGVSCANCGLKSAPPADPVRAQLARDGKAWSETMGHRANPDAAYVQAQEDAYWDNLTGATIGYGGGR